MAADRGTGTTRGLRPLNVAEVLWVAALDRVPIEERIEWVATMEQRVAEINAARAQLPASSGFLDE